jgi:hypothetical protein
MTENNGQAVHPILAAGVDQQQAAHLTIAHHHKAADGSEYLREGDGYRQIVGPWENEQHISPFRAQEKLGSVEAWCAYVTRFSTSPAPLLTWSAAGLRAVLDYGTREAPGRGQVVVTHPFERTRQWLAWERLAAGRPCSQRELIEALEDRREDVREPAAADLVEMLRKLRGTVNAQAVATLDPNGGTKLEYTRQTQTSLTLPQTITIGIPVLKGHTAKDNEGIEGPVTYEIDVRIRVDVLDEGKIAFRLTLPNAEQALEDAVADRVRAAQMGLGELGGEYEILRAAS